MRFPYAGYTIRGTVPNSKALVFRPMVPVRVIGPTGDRDVFGRVDSGADDTMLPAAVAGAIGVTGLTPPVAIGGIGGNVLASFGTVDLEISDGQTVYRWQAYVGFCSHTLPVLGLKGFLQFFTATFDGQSRSLDLIPNNLAAPPAAPIP